MAAFQSSPKPISRDAFLSSVSHHANSRFAIARSSSGEYAIISCASSTSRPLRPIGSPTTGSSFPGSIPTTFSLRIFT